MTFLTKLLFFFLLSFSTTLFAGWQDTINDLKKSIDKKSSSIPSISEETVAKALKQALDQSVRKSVAELGKSGGFLKDGSVKIPMPKSLRKLDKGLRKIGQAKLADKFIDTMNHAAEKAVTRTVDILIQAVKSLSLKDAILILKGEPDAATQFFKRKSTANLRRAIKPIVVQATSSVGLTHSYKKMMKKAGFLSKYVDKDSLDIDQYITNRAVDGIFVKIALEEKRIRSNPAARTTDLLKQVFENQ